jgi:hypothetical protein
MTGILWATIQQPIAIPRRYCCGEPHHITLAYGVDRFKYEELIGLPMTVGVTGEAWNDRIQAIEVVLPSWVPCQNPHPHISVSWVQDAQPVESNMMLAGEHESAQIEFDHLHTIVEFQEWGAKDDRPTKCPNCGASDRIVKIGRTQHGRQRFKCKDCGKAM